MIVTNDIVANFSFFFLLYILFYLFVRLCYEYWILITYKNIYTVVQCLIFISIILLLRKFDNLLFLDILRFIYVV